MATSSHPTVALVIALSGALLACGDTPAPDASADGLPRTRIDTVGDTLVARTEGDVPAAAEWRVVEEWRVGDPDDPAVGFGRIGQTAIAADGAVYVFDPTGPELRQYDARGAYVRTIGRRGGGPGEYERSNGVAVLSDGRIALWDGGGARVNLYDSAGSYLGLARAPVSGFSTSGNMLMPHPDGDFWLAGHVQDSAFGNAVLGRDAWFRYVGDAITDTVLEPPAVADPPQLLAEVEGSRSSMSVPYFPTPGIAFAVDGAVWQYRGDGYVLHRDGGDGRPLRIERTVSAVPIADEERAEQRARATWNMRRTQPDWRWNGPEIPTAKAPVADLVALADGRLLVRVAVPSERFEPEPPPATGETATMPVVHFRSAHAFERFDADGRLEGRFTLPVDARLLAARGDRIWCATTDELGVPYLVQARLEQE